MFGTGDYTYRTSWVSSVSPSLSTPSTCFTPRYFSSSTATYRTPFSRYDRSNSTPLRYNETVGHYYNRCVSENSSSNYQGYKSRYETKLNTASSTSTATSTSNITRYEHYPPSTTASAAAVSPPRDKLLDATLPGPGAAGSPLYSQHVARYYKRIKDIFDQQNGSTEEKIDKQSLVQNEAEKTRPSYKRTVTKLDTNTRSRENLRKTLHTTDVTPRRRSPEPCRYRRPIDPRSSVPSTDYKTTLERGRYRCVPTTSTTPPSPISPSLHSEHNKANILTGTDRKLYETPEPEPLKPRPSACLGSRSGPYYEARPRYPNMETRLASMLLDHIRAGEKWTSSVDRPFVLGI